MDWITEQGKESVEAEARKSHSSNVGKKYIKSTEMVDRALPGMCEGWDPTPLNKEKEKRA